MELRTYENSLDQTSESIRFEHPIFKLEMQEWLPSYTRMVKTHSVSSLIKELGKSRPNIGYKLFDIQLLFAATTKGTSFRWFNVIILALNQFSARVCDYYQASDWSDFDQTWLVCTKHFSD